MDFAGFRSGIQAEINSWRLPDRIIREFNSRLIHDLTAMKIKHFMSGESSYFYGFSIEDPETPGKYYDFKLHIKASELHEAYWIVQVDLFFWGEDGIIVKTASA